MITPSPRIKWYGENRLRHSQCQLLILLAASIPPSKLSTLKPPDLWTRVEHRVVLRHPLWLEEEAQRQAVLRQYFCRFCRDELDKLEKKGWAGEPLFSDSRREETLSHLPNSFAKILDSPLIPLVSIRTLRTMVKGVLSNVLLLLSTDPRRKDSRELMRKIEARMGKWIIRIFQDVVPAESDPRGVF